MLELSALCKLYHAHLDLITCLEEKAHKGSCRLVALPHGPAVVHCFPRGRARQLCDPFQPLPSDFTEAAISHAGPSDSVDAAHRLLFQGWVS